ncbi:hypothetical protein DMUE_3411 [Dictyocoela muelleri]|nr:hypothetical protein DMUE_3411 [Dictyocoela muelleri]
MKKLREKLTEIFIGVVNERSSLTRRPHCFMRVYIVKNLGHVRCRNRFGRYQFPLHKNTIFYNNKLKNEEILEVIYFLLQGERTGFICSIKGVSKPTIRRLRLALSCILNNILNRNIGKIGGKGVIVEIDESKLWKRKYNRCHTV